MQGLNEEAWFPRRVKGEEKGRRCDQHSAKTWRLSGGQWGTADYSKAGGGSSLRPVTSQTTLVFTHAMYSQPPCDRRWCGLALTAKLSRFFKRECRISHNVLWFSCSLLPESVILLFLSSSTLHIPLLMHPQSVILDTSKTSKAHHSAWHTAGAGQWMRNEKSTEIIHPKVWICLEWQLPGPAGSDPYLNKQGLERRALLCKALSRSSALRFDDKVSWLGWASDTQFAFLCW